MGGRNAIDDFREFDTACLSTLAFADNTSTETFFEVATS
jgi:hypothetical protein